MKRSIFVLVTALVLMATPAMAIQGADAQAEPFLKVVQDPALGAVLTDAAGMTLYLFTRDTTAGESVCNDDCATNWPPLAPADDMTLPPGVPGELTVIDRDDGTQQVAYNGIPLYYWIRDTAPGETTGQDVGGVWFIVPPGAAHGPYAEAPGEGTPVPVSTVKIGFTEALGPFLIDAEGKTLYLFTNDTTAGESVCNDDCATNWPPVPAADVVTLPPGITGTLAPIARADGSMQLAYNDIPLYYFARDENPGDTNGQGAGDVWYIVPPGMMFGDPPHVEAMATPAA